MTIQSWREFNEPLAATDADRDVRCLVLAGEGRAFFEKREPRFTGG